MNNSIDFLKQHKDNYKNIIKNMIENNTSALVDEDIKSIIKKPPLDSMDLIREKLLSLAKKNNTVLNTENLKRIVDEYREKCLECLVELKKIRNSKLCSIIEKFDHIKDTDIIKFSKKDFYDLNKMVKKILKDSFSSNCDLILLDNLDELFSKDIDMKVKKKIIEDFSKFMKNKYHKQILENIDIKVLIKDTTLINIIKEQGERYLYTIENSRLLNEIK